MTFFLKPRNYKAIIFLSQDVQFLKTYFKYELLKQSKKLMHTQKYCFSDVISVT